MHRERRALHQQRRAQEVELHLTLGERQLALGDHARGILRIAVDDNAPADRPAHREVARIDQQRNPQLRGEIVKVQGQIVHPYHAPS